MVWQHYGEQYTFWFYHLARERQAQTTITHICTSTEPRQTVTLDSFQATQQAAQALQAYYSASSPDGLFAPPQTSLEAQDALLAAVDCQLSAEQHQKGEEAAADGSIPRVARLQALTACHTSSTSASGTSWGRSSQQCFRRPSSQAVRDSCPQT